MRRAQGSRFLIFIGVLSLSACAEGAFDLGTGDSASDTASATGTVTREGAQDVERPDIFTTSEPALWDGRPSLGGIWIAHPDVTDPERAILINESTGQRVAGALFRRERDVPGPRLQLSSDAAAALHVLAGQPTEVTVIAVRRVEIEVPDPEADPEAGEDTAESDADATDGDAVEPVDGDAAATAEEAAQETPRRRNFFERLFGPRRSASASEIAAGAESATEGAVAADGAGAAPIETQTLDPVAATTAAAAAAISRAEASDKPAPRPSRTEEAAAPAVAAPSIETPAATEESEPVVSEPEATPPAQELRNPFIQVGLYTVEANAESAAAELRQAGIVPTVLQGERDDGSSFWRVVVGPVTTADDQAALLGQVRAAGYGDAFLAPN